MARIPWSLFIHWNPIHNVHKFQFVSSHQNLLNTKWHNSCQEGCFLPLPLCHLDEPFKGLASRLLLSWMFLIVLMVFWRQKIRVELNGLESQTEIHGEHCSPESFWHPESFCAGNFFLPISIGNSLESLRRVWKVSGLSGKLPDYLKDSRVSGKFIGHLESFHSVGEFP